MLGFAGPNMPVVESPVQFDSKDTGGDGGLFRGSSHNSGTNHLSGAQRRQQTFGRPLPQWDPGGKVGRDFGCSIRIRDPSAPLHCASAVSSLYPSNRMVNSLKAISLGRKSARLDEIKSTAYISGSVLRTDRKLPIGTLNF